MLNTVCLCSACHVRQMTKKERKKYGLLPPKIAESDTQSLGHGICGSGGPLTMRAPHSKQTFFSSAFSNLSEWLLQFLLVSINIKICLY
jgi:hypothetical protein